MKITRLNWCAVLLLLVVNVTAANYQFDFGAAGTEPGYVAVDNVTTYPGPAGYYGWLSTNGLNLRDRGEPGLLRRDFIFTTVSSATFRVSGLAPSGKYLMKVLCGDASFGDHVITVSVPGTGTLPTISPHTYQFLQLSTSVNADASGNLEITFGSPTPNWALNALTLAPTNTDIAPVVESVPYNDWDESIFNTDPTTNLLNRFNGTGAVGFTPTGLTRSNYLTLITSEIDFWKTKQNSSGAIIDPYRNAETQYSTPAFANAAAALVVYANRSDLLEPAAKAMDWASLRLHNNQGADGHDDFYPAMLAHALRLLSPLVDPTRAATWRTNLDYDPYVVYDYAPGTLNWTVISSSGDALLQMMGIRATNNPYVTEVWAAQGRHMLTPYGMYLEGPMCYDIFPRIFWCDALEQGYAGPYSTQVRKAVDRAVITSLFMQSPWGELPAGGRSAHHQWNEAEQCLLYEIYAGKAKAASNTLMAAAYKRAAHLAFSSMTRWVRPTGEMQIIKNWVDPSSRFAYESYSYHSQYNNLPMMMLATAFEYAATSEDVVEGPAPADTGGFVFQLDRIDTPTRAHKIFANAGGTYVEIESKADNAYDATGLIRVHQKGVSPQLGPSDSLLTSASYNSPNPAPLITGVGVSWLDTDGTTWRTLGEMATELTTVTLTPISQSTTQVVFDITYAGSLPNATSITEHYIVTPSGVQLTTQVSGYSGALRYVWPVLYNDGKTISTINVSSNAMAVSQGGTATTFTAPGSQNVSVGTTDYSNHNGWARVATANFAGGSAITLVISQAASNVVSTPLPSVGPVYFVNATSGASGNTTLTNGGVFSPPLNGTTGFDNNWEERTTNGSSGNIFESGGEVSGENAPRLVTTITNLIPGASYKVFAYFWSKAASSTTEQWLLRAGLTNTVGDLTLYGTTGSSLMSVSSTAATLISSTNGFAVAPTTNSESGRLLYQAALGQTVANGSGSIPVYIDDYAPNTTVNNRTWYDGVGYALVTAANATNLTAAAAGGQLNLTWPADHAGWVLQTRTNALTGQWFDVPGSAALTGLSIPINPSAPAIFFRIRSP
ncbi:MAG: hypothetical protein RLY20_3228 [Verrucomicrobiota bacterium]|jgi:hypothetical protein